MSAALLCYLTAKPKRIIEETQRLLSEAGTVHARGVRGEVHETNAAVAQQVRSVEELISVVIKWRHGVWHTSVEQHFPLVIFASYSLSTIELLLQIAIPIF